MALLSMCIQLMQEQIMDKIAWVMAEIGMSNSNSNEEMVKVTKMDRLKQTPADMTGNELDFNVKRRKNNMNKNQGNLCHISVKMQKSLLSWYFYVIFYGNKYSTEIRVFYVTFL